MAAPLTSPQKGIAMPTAFSTQSFDSEKKQQKSDKRLRVAIIGCGGISDVHFRTLQSFPDVEVVAAVDTRSERLDWAQEKHGITQVFKDWREMLKKVKPDA